MVIASVLVACLLAVASAGQIRDDPNEQCSWRGLRDCPIESSGSAPICDNTNPAEVAPGIYGMKICASESPKAIGGKFDVGMAVFGTILTVDVIPQSSKEGGENNINCSNGEGSVGTRVFSAHCEVTGPGKIRGYWAITFKSLGSEEVQIQ